MWNIDSSAMRLRLNRSVLVVLLASCSACSSQVFNRALYSMGEQADCASANDNRVDERARYVTCLADASNANEYVKYHTERDQLLSE